MTIWSKTHKIAKQHHTKNLAQKLANMSHQNRSGQRSNQTSKPDKNFTFITRWKKEIRKSLSGFRLVLLKPVYDKTFFCISGSTVFLQSLDWHAGILIHKPRQQNLCADTDGTGCETIGAGWETCGATDLFKNSCPIKTCSKNQYYNNDNKRSFHKKC